MSFLTELKRRLSQQPLQQGQGQTPLQRIASGIPVVNEPPELNGIGVANDVGISGRSNRPSDVIRPQQQPQRRSLPYGIQEIPNAPYDPDPLSKIQPIPNANPNEPLNMQLLRQQGQQQTYSQNINPTVRPQPQPAAQGNWRDLVKQGVTPASVMSAAQPTPQPQPTLDQALMSGGPTQAEQPANATMRDSIRQQLLQTPSAQAAMGGQQSTMQRNPYRDQLTQDEAQLRALEDKKDKFWKRAVIAGINAGQAGFGYQPTQIQTGRTRDIAKIQGRIARDIKYQQPEFRAQQQDEREINNALTQYNRLEHFDPTDPADAGFAQYFRERGLDLPAKDKYHRPVATWANGRLILTDNKGTREATIGGDPNKPVVDDVRVPTDITVDGRTYKMPQGQAARSQVQMNEGKANRAAATGRTQAQIDAANARASKALAEKTREFNNPKPKPVAPEKLGEKTKQDIAQGFADHDTYHEQLTQIDDEIQKANALPANWTQQVDGPNNTKVTQTKNDYLRDLGESRKGLVGRAKKRMTYLNQIDPNNEWGSGEGGYPYHKAKGGQAAATSGPQSDGKHHYTMAQIQATIDPKTGKTKSGLRLEEVLNKLRNDQRAVIDDDQK